VRLNILSDLHLNPGALEVPRNDADAQAQLHAGGKFMR